MRVDTQGGAQGGRPSPQQAESPGRIVDAVDTVEGQRRYGLHYDEEPQDRYLTSGRPRRGAAAPRAHRTRIANARPAFRVPA